MKTLKEALGEAEERAMTLVAEKDHALKQLRSHNEVRHISVNIKTHKEERGLIFLSLGYISGSAEGVEPDGRAEAEV